MAGLQIGYDLVVPSEVSFNLLRLCTKPKLLTGIGFGGDPIRARVTV